MPFHVTRKERLLITWLVILVCLGIAGTWILN